MSRKILKNLITILSAILAAELIFVGIMHITGRNEDVTLSTTPSTTQESTTVPETTEATVAATAAPTTIPETTAPAPTETQPTETEPQEQRYVLSFVGDCTLGSDPGQFASPHSFVGTVGENYDYPFEHVREFFEADDFTIINLESVLADKGSGTSKLFTFRGPTAYTQILTGSSVEAVTLANNHTEDFGKDGYKSTVDALTEAGVHYVEEEKTTLITTESGLTIGLYADSFYFSNSDIQKNVKKLRDEGAEIIICAFHWGTEGSYRATKAQEGYAKVAIDAGADIVYGHHPHVLQKIEEYNGGIIYYSLGNFSFGGNTYPRDKDSAILQQEIIRDVDGNVSLGELTIIPVSISSSYKTTTQNNFQPIPYEEGSKEYDRTLSKLDGTFTGPDLVVDYSNLKDPDPTQAPTTTNPPATEAPAGTTPPATEAPAGTTPPATEAPAATNPPATEAPAATNPPATEAPAATNPPATEAPAATNPPATEAPAATNPPAPEAPPATNPPAEQPPADNGGESGT